MAIGILGGTFDPVHNAHIAVAQLAMRQLNLENVLFLPAGDPPHKHARASRWARMEMVRLAVAQTGFSSCDIEVVREGTTYTVDTLRTLRARYPQAEFFYIIGTDTLYQLPSWRCFAQVKELTQFAVVRRVGEDVAHAHAFAKSIGIRAAFIEIDAPPISSTDVRLRIQRAQSIDGLLPESVCMYIYETGQYAPSAHIMEQLRRALPIRRFEHTLGVIDTAVSLAARYGVNERQAYLAAALHDCAKGMTTEQMFVLTHAGPEWQQYPQTLHAWAGEILAERDYNVFDPEVLSAIRKHTTAHAVMTMLDMLVYVADAIEPGRKVFTGLNTLRALAARDLVAAAHNCAESSYRYNLSAGRTVHPDTLKFLGIETEEEA